MTVDTNSELESTISSSPVDILAGRWYVLQMRPGEIARADAVCVYRDDSEVTVVVRDTRDREDFLRDHGVTGCEGPFGGLRLRVARPFVARGFLAAVTSALAGSSINVYVLSTFTFDYVLVRSDALELATQTLVARGFPLGEVPRD